MYVEENSNIKCSQNVFIMNCTHCTYNHKFIFPVILAQILKTTRRGGNVLLAVDTAGRVLELSQLLVCLEQSWPGFLS